MESIFDAVKVAVTLPDAARAYGYTPNRSGFIRCPFHQERTPSMKLYDRRFHCFGCGAHGTVIDFVGGLFSLTPLEAARKINEDFRLRLNDRPPDWTEQDRPRQLQEARDLFEGWKETMLNRLDSAIRIANLANYDELTDGEALALRYREALEYWAGILAHAPLDKQMDVFRDREGVERLCGRISQGTPTKSRTA